MPTAGDCAGEAPVPRGAVSPWTQQIEAAERWPQGTGLGLRGDLWGGRWAPPGGGTLLSPGSPTPDVQKECAVPELEDPTNRRGTPRPP